MLEHNELITLRSLSLFYWDKILNLYENYKKYNTFIIKKYNLKNNFLKKTTFYGNQQVNY